MYARVSSEEQVQGYSIQAQRRACREWAEKHG
ncbi:MAG: recombinase family protein [Candidatus Binatia bacterium]